MGRKEDPVTALSKAMVKLLRHDARKRSLELDTQGFAPLRLALQAVDAGWVGPAALEARWREVVAAQERGPEKQRFEEETRAGEVWVRALQGHTIPRDPAKMYTRVTAEVEFAFHGTARRCIEPIFDEGITTKRNGVHLYVDLAHLYRQASATQRQAVVVVNVKEAVAAGVHFYNMRSGITLLGPKLIEPRFIAGWKTGDVEMACPPPREDVAARALWRRRTGDGPGEPRPEPRPEPRAEAERPATRPQARGWVQTGPTSWTRDSPAAGTTALDPRLADTQEHFFAVTARGQHWARRNGVPVGVGGLLCWDPRSLKGYFRVVEYGRSREVMAELPPGWDSVLAPGLWSHGPAGEAGVWSFAEPMEEPTEPDPDKLHLLASVYAVPEGFPPRGS